MNLVLQEGEELLLNLKPHPRTAWYFLLSRLWHFLLLGGFWIVYFFFILKVKNYSFFNFHLNEKGSALDLSALLGILLAVVVVGLLYFFFKLVIKSYDYQITNQRVMLSFGLVALNHRIIPLAQINDIDMRATIFERFFGLGSIYVDTIGTILGSVGSRRSALNNTSRMEGLTYAQCEEVMAVLSKHIQKQRAR